MPLPTDTPAPLATHAPLPTDTPTPLATNTPAPLPTDTPTPLPTSTPTVTATATLAPTAIPDLIFADGFESGNLSNWTASVTGGGNLSVNSASAMSGIFGLQAVIANNTAIYLTDDTPNAEASYRARFYFNPNSIAMANGNAHYIFYGYSGTSTVVLRIELRYSSGNYQLRMALVNNSTGWSTSNWFTITNARHYIELNWLAATGVGANNGSLTFWIDGVQMATLTGINNNTRRIDRIRLGPVAGIDSGTRGTYYFDTFESRRSSYIGQ